MSKIDFEAKPYEVNSWIILLLPKSASLKLPSRGMVMVEGTINGVTLKTTLEPDGRGSHWFRIDEKLAKSAKLSTCKNAKLSIESSDEWVEPDVPSDIKKALTGAPKQYELWKNNTPIARWDWIRWIRATKSDDTRKKRIEVALSKMKRGEKRPCCFNRSACTEPFVSNGLILIEPKT